MPIQYNPAKDEEAAVKAVIDYVVGEAIKLGLMKAQIQPATVTLLTKQLMILIKVCRDGRSMSPAGAIQVLAQQQVSVMALVAGDRYPCIVAIALFSTSLAGAAFATTYSGPLGPLIQAGKLLHGVYTMDNACGFSDAAYKQIERVGLPIYQEIYSGILQSMSRGY
jgi:hypothetical protein